MTYEAHTLIAPMAYTCCWQSVSVRLCGGNDCILRRVGEWPQVGWHVRNSVGVATSERKILLPMYQVYSVVAALRIYMSQSALRSLALCAVKLKLNKLKTI